MIKKVPESLRNFLNMIQAELPKIIPDILVGVYVYGSISYGDFEEHRSDVDIAVIIKRKLNKSEIQKLADWYKTNVMQSSKWIKRLEMDYITIKNVTSDIKNDTWTTRFTGEKLKDKAKFDGATIDWENIRTCGIPLLGPLPKTFMIKASEKLLFNALIDKFSHLKENIFKWVKIDLWNQVFVIVQLCRVVYACQNKNEPISKKGAVCWCVKNLPNEFRPMVSVALSKIDNDKGQLEKEITDNLPAFVKYIESLLQQKIKK